MVKTNNSFLAEKILYYSATYIQLLRHSTGILLHKTFIPRSILTDWGLSDVYCFATNYRRLPIIATRKQNIHISVMVIYFKSFLLCICSIHFGNSFTLFAIGFGCYFGEVKKIEFCLAIIGTRR